MIKNILDLIPKKFVLLGLLIMLCCGAFAQNENSNIGIESKFHYGFLMSHHEYMQMMSEKHFSIFQLNVFKAGNHNNNWSFLYNFPQYGISAIYSPLSSPQYIGDGYGLMSFINFPLIKSKQTTLYFYVGAGLGYLTKKFDRLYNYKNHAIGSNFNAVLMGQFDYKFSVSKNIEISSGLSVLHFSNGKISVPNLGINSISTHIGCAYLMPVKTTEKPIIQNTHNDKKLEHSIFYGIAIKQTYPAGGKYYTANTLSYNIKKTLNQKRKLGLGMDLFYDFSDKASFEKKGFDEKNLTYMKNGIYIIHDYRLNKASIFLHLGTYIYAFEKNQGVGMIYDRLGFQYYFNNVFSAHIALKTHYAKADFIEWAMNISF